MSAEFPLTPSGHLADSDLARRSRLSALFYLMLYAVIITATPYAKDHTLVAVLISGVILLCAVLRSWLVVSFETLYPARPAAWLNGFTVLTLLLAGTWGFLCAHTVFSYGLHWTAMLTLLSTAGISAGAVTTLSIHRYLIVAFLALLLLPATAVAAFLHTTESVAVTVMFISFFIFLIGVASRLNKEYWRATDNALLLDRRARELEASNEELESYSYSIAHDLRTPLRSIIGFSQILQQDLGEKLSRSERDDLERVIDAGKHMADLIDDILELSRITRRELSPERVDMSRLVQEKADALRAGEPQRSVQFTIQPRVMAIGDARLLDVAIQNLMENAWKFTRNREQAEVVFSAKKQDDETVYSLADNGVGFDMAHAGRLFRPFDRLHRLKEFPGTGVGLATVKRIILRHGGRIWADAEPGHGACFYFTLR